MREAIILAWPALIRLCGMLVFLGTYYLRRRRYIGRRPGNKKIRRSKKLALFLSKEHILIGV